MCIAASDMLGAILEGKILSKDVINWLFNEKESGTFLDPITCTKGEFVSYLLNFLRDSTSRFLQPSGYITPQQSPSKASTNHHFTSTPKENAKTKERTVLTPIKKSANSPIISGHSDRISNSPCSSDHKSKQDDLHRRYHSYATSAESQRNVSNYKSSGDETTASSTSNSDPKRAAQQRKSVTLADFLFSDTKTQKRHDTSQTSPSSCTQSCSTKKKVRRRINPTKIVPEDSSNSGFPQNASFGILDHALSSPSPFQDELNVNPSIISTCFAEERSLLKNERLKLLTSGNTSKENDLSISSRSISCPRVTVVSVSPDPLKVSYKDYLLCLCDIYCATLDGNLVPNLMSELYFIFSLLVSSNEIVFDNSESMNSSCNTDSESFLIGKDSAESEQPCSEKTISETSYFCSVHNCIFFAANVLLKQMHVLSYCDRITLKLLRENDRLALFMPNLRACLVDLYSKAYTGFKISSGTASSAFKSTVNGNVSFQSETDNSSNFSSQNSFCCFRKQRDGFYELINIWEANHMDPGWDFALVLGSKIKVLLQLCSDPVNYVHLARLFRLQLISTVVEEPAFEDESTVDLEILQCLRAVDPEKLTRLRERLITPRRTSGPRPQPSFPGPQEFYRDFLLAAANSPFGCHVQDGFISHLLELNETPFFASDMEDNDCSVDEGTRLAYYSCVSTMRLLAKFLGFLIFLPYQRPEMKVPVNIIESEISVRFKVGQPLNILECLIDAYRSQRMVVTVPWVVEFLGMIDMVSASLPYYNTTLRLLSHYYSFLVTTVDKRKRSSSVIPPQSVVMLRLILGWLFDSPVFSEDLYWSWNLNLDNIESILERANWNFLSTQSIASGCTSLSVLDTSEMTTTSTLSPVDSLELVNHEVLYAMCPFLMELRAVLMSASDPYSTSNGPVRHITPVSASFNQHSSSPSAKQLELQLEESFFHGLPASVHKTVDFVIERVVSICVKYMCNVWLPGLKIRGVDQLHKKIKESFEDSNLDAVELQEQLSVEVELIVDHVLSELKDKCRSCIADMCSSKCRGALKVLLSEDLLGSGVCEMCMAIAARTSTDRVISWMQTHATLSMYSKELGQEVDKAIKQRQKNEVLAMAKNSHIARGTTAEWEHDDKTTSSTDSLNAIKLLIRSILENRSKKCLEKEHVLHVLNIVEESVTKRQDVVPAAERTLASLSVDLIILLVSHYPEMVDAMLLQRMVQLWKLDVLRPVEDNLSRLICPRNVFLLANSDEAPNLVWETLARLMLAVLEANLVTPELVESQCIAIMQQDWPQDVLNNLSTTMKEVVKLYLEQNEADFKFVLLMDWLSETMEEMNYFPD